jgi:hypothetical protein
MIEEELYELLETLGVAVFPQIAPDNQKVPYITFTDITSIRKKFAGGTLKNIKSRWQLDIYQSSSLKAKQLRDEVIAKIDIFPLSSRDISYRDGYEPRVKIYRQIVEFYTKQQGTCNGNQ